MPSRRTEPPSSSLRPPSAGAGPSSLTTSSARPRMYNLTAHALSSGSLLPRSSVDSPAQPLPGAGAVSAADAPYLTNVENHWGRVTLTAPDNMRRRQAKEKKQKARQKKAQTAHVAAAALAGVAVQPSVANPGSRPPSTPLNLSDNERRVEDTALPGASLLTTPVQPAIRRGHSGNSTVTLATSPVQDSARRIRRRRTSTTREESDRPPSRSNAPARNHNHFDTPAVQPGPGVHPQVQPNATRDVQASSMHRQNIWNDITDPDPDDLPPPFPQGATRPPSPPQPPPHSQSGNDQQLVGPQPHVRLPDSPPPAFRSDPESESDGIVSNAEPLSRRQSSASSRNRTSLPPEHSITSESSDEDEPAAIALERQAWEADIRDGLSFEQRLLREQQRRVARERAGAFTLAPPTAQEAEEIVPLVKSVHPDVLETAQRRRASAASTQPPRAEAVDAAVATVPLATRTQSSSAVVDTQGPHLPTTRVDETAEPVLAVSATPHSTIPASRGETAPAVSVSARQALQNETRLGLPAMRRNPVNTAQRNADSTVQRSTHRKTNSDTQSVAHIKLTGASGRTTSRLAARPVSAVPRLRVRSASGTSRPLDTDTSTAKRRPEDTLFVISAPPAVATDRTGSDVDEASRPVTPALVSTPALSTAQNVDLSSASDGEGAESDSSIEQWLAESAAFDALRRKEEEVAARMRAIQELQVSDSDEDGTDVMPGGYNHRRQAHQAASRRKGPDPADLALLDKARPKAPPPLVLGRSRGGGAAYSDSSSDSTDTDDALDQYSSSDEAHPAYQHRPQVTQPDLAPAETKSVDPTTAFVQSRSSTLSAPDLTGVYKQPPLPPRPQALVANESHVPDASRRASIQAEQEGKFLSSTARGKLPERSVSLTKPALPLLSPPDVTAEGRAGDFQADDASSRDVSDVDEIADSATRRPLPDQVSVQPKSGQVVQLPPAQASRASLPLLQTSASSSSSNNVSRSSLDPLLQPLSYGRPRATDLGGRLKGLFGQPLISPTEAIAAEAGRSANEGIRSPDTETAPAKPAQLSSKKAEEPSDRLQVVEPQPPLSARKDRVLDNDPQSRADQASVHSTKTIASAVTKRPAPEERVREEALSQIAQLSSTTSAQRDSLAALERLLVRTSRPASMAPSTVPSHRFSVQGPRQLPAEPGLSEQNVPDTRQIPPIAPILPNPSRLSRQGAITRGKHINDGDGSSRLAPPVTFQTTGSARPVSFVNPRSSAAPLPRGRLPAITDATRHFPPSAQNSNPVQQPSWLVNIPASDNDRLPDPIEPHRLSTSRADGNGVHSSPATSSRVSQMISRFEGSSAAPPVPLREQPSSASIASAKQHGEFRTDDNSIATQIESEPALDQLRRRPPPPPPLPAVATTIGANLTRRSDVRSVEVQRISAMEALTRQIDEATTSWSSPQRASQVLDREAPPASTGASAAPEQIEVPRSPRTLALDNLTRRDSLATPPPPPPRLPSKSPLMTPEQIFAGGSRTGLSASIAAAQAASLARRASRAARSESNASSTKSRISPSRTDGDSSAIAGLFAAEPSQLTYGLEPSSSSLGGTRLISTLTETSAHAESGRRLLDSADITPSPKRLPVPPPLLPQRPPREREWQTSSETSGPVLAPPARDTRDDATLMVATTAADGSDSSGNDSHEPPSDDLHPQLRTRQTRREASLGLTDFDLLVAQLERDGTHFEQLSAIGEFLGPARATSATAEQIASLSVGTVECDTRRVTRDGKVKQKLSCVGVRVDKCTICQAQFKQGQMAAILPCLHLFHEVCATQLFRRVNTCPTCRRLAFDF